MELTEKILEMLLKEAEAAHRQHEADMGKKDEEWASWYAKYIIGRMHGK